MSTVSEEYFWWYINFSEFGVGTTFEKTLIRDQTWLAGSSQQLQFSLRVQENENKAWFSHTNFTIK